MGEHRFWEVDGNGKAIQNHGTIPSEAAEEETSRPALAQAWRPFMDYNPDNGILAMVTQLGETLEIYNLKDSTHKVLYGPNGGLSSKQRVTVQVFRTELWDSMI